MIGKLDNIKFDSFDEVVEYRKGIGYEVYGVSTREGARIDRAWYMDLSWECIEELADAMVYLSFEVSKLDGVDSKIEMRRINSTCSQIRSAANSLWDYRERLKQKYPFLFKETLEDEIRAGNIREV